TFNGHSFDLPVLRYRAMVNRVPAAGLQVRQYFHRYTEDALDLCDVLGSYVPGAKVRLDDVSKILGLSGKPFGIDVSRVEEMVLAGQIEEVARYCETDVPAPFAPSREPDAPDPLILSGDLTLQTQGQFQPEWIPEEEPEPVRRQHWGIFDEPSALIDLNL